MSKDKPEVRILEVDDWVRLFVNGVCVEENHSIPAHRALEYIPGIDFERRYLECELSTPELLHEFSRDNYDEIDFDLLEECVDR